MQIHLGWPWVLQSRYATNYFHIWRGICNTTFWNIKIWKKQAEYCMSSWFFPRNLLTNTCITCIKKARITIIIIQIYAIFSNINFFQSIRKKRLYIFNYESKVIIKKYPLKTKGTQIPMEIARVVNIAQGIKDLIPIVSKFRFLLWSPFFKNLCLMFKTIKCIWNIILTDIFSCTSTSSALK